MNRLVAFLAGLASAFLVVLPPVTAAETTTPPPAEAVRELLARLLPGRADSFVVEIIPADPAGDVLEIESQEGRVVLRGSDGPAVAAALNWYLKYHAHAHHSVTGGSQLRLPDPLPAVPSKIRRVGSARRRYFLNYCCYGYSLPWYHWPQWERLIDWMALQGVNLPLAVTGQEAVWQAVGRRLGLDDTDLRAFLAGPPYLPFGWMGCLDGHGGPLPQSWIDGHLDLARQILRRERELGMRPVLQGFTGHVPAAIARKFPQARFQKIRWIEWETLVLDPLDPLFPRIAAAFLEEQTRLLGTDHFYAADTFIEMIPPSGDTNYLAHLGRAIHDGLAATDPQATWVLQGWPFFYARDFWSQPRIEAVLGSVPDDRILLLDLYCEKTPVWNLTRAFCGKPWVWCNIQSFGNRVWLGGALDRINRDPFAARRDPASGGLTGLGFVNEGLDYNPVVYDLLFELAWRDAPVDLDPWLRGFAERAYGRPHPEADLAWNLLRQTTYQDAFDNAAAATAFPSLAPFPDAPYDSQRLAHAWRHLLAAAGDLHAADPFRFDLVNVTRQVLANHSATLQHRVIDAFQARNRPALHEATAAFQTLLRDLDELLATRPEFLLGPWLDDARRWGAHAAESDRLEWNARRVLTLWGDTPALRDYSTRQWSGLLSGFHAGRWDLFFRRLDQALDRNDAFAAESYAAEVLAFENAWAAATNRPPTTPRGDSVEVSRRLWSRYGAAVSQVP